MCRDDSKTMSGDSQHSNSDIKRKKSNGIQVTSFFKIRMHRMRRNMRKKSASIAAAAPPAIDEVSPKGDRQSAKGMITTYLNCIRREIDW
jgi:hypothetical protein